MALGFGARFTPAQMAAMRKVQDAGASVVSPSVAQAQAAAAIAPTPTIAPFNTADEQLQLSQADADSGTALANRDATNASAQADYTKNIAMLDQSTQQNTRSEADSMIARGLFRSGIDQTALQDINAAAAIQKQNLDSSLAIITGQANNTYNTIANHAAQMHQILAGQAILNAQNITPATPPPATAAAPAPTPVTAKPAVNAIKPLPATTVKLPSTGTAGVNPFAPPVTAKNAFGGFGAGIKAAPNPTGRTQF